MSWDDDDDFDEREEEEEEVEDEEEEDDDEEEQDDEDYDARLLAVTRALAKAEPPGASFACGSHRRFPLPGLTVAGVGDVALPLTQGAATQLIDKCRIAPFGRGEQTLVDTSVRNTWELDAKDIELRNPEWRKLEREIVESLRLPMGIGEHTKYEAKLYKMLLYETGGLFTKHRDTEKEVGMFGTLVVVLPGHFAGGQLVVRAPSHAATGNDAPSTWDPATMNPFDLKYAAFYGDCEHEVLPVTSGFRLCLTYNLVVSPGAHHVPRSGGNRVLYTQLLTALSAYFLPDPPKAKKVPASKAPKRRRLNESVTEPQAPPSPVPAEPRACRLVSVLDHKYTDTGLSFALLKGRDRIVAEALARFCDENAGLFSLFLSRVKYTHTTDGMEEDEDEFSVELLSPWVPYGAPKGSSMAVSGVHAEPMTEVAPAGVFAHVAFDGEDYPDDYGNEGSRVEQWYKTAALVVQPRNVSTKPRWSMY